MQQIRDSYIGLIHAISSIEPDVVSVIYEEMLHCLQAGNTIYWVGNGGSQSQCQHLSAELMGRFKSNRPGLRSLALGTDPSLMTALVNDFPPELAFGRQLVLCKEGDILMLLSASGNSPNIRSAVDEANGIGVTTIGLTGREGSYLGAKADVCMHVDSGETAHIQEVHLFIGHLLCGMLESAIFP